MAFSFFGGIHPKENKWYSCDREIEEFPEPDILVVPMSQHIGAPCKPLVKKGDSVTVGQKIGECQGLGVPVHAPVSGKVKAVEMRAHTSGTSVMSVVIENDHKKTLCPEVQPRTQEQVDGLSPQELMDIILPAIDTLHPKDARETHLLNMLRTYLPLEQYDDQMKELFTFFDTPVMIQTM